MNNFVFESADAMLDIIVIVHNNTLRTWRFGLENMKDYDFYLPLFFLLLKHNMSFFFTEYSLTLVSSILI